jgi:hypothetical protein
MKKFIAVLSIVAFLTANHVAIASTSQVPQVWLSGEDPIVQARKHINEPADYMDLFKPESPWSSAASKLEAFKIGSEMTLRSSDEQLRTIIENLKARHIKLGIEMGLIGGVGPDGCGKGVEGYSAPAGPEAQARRIKALGGQIDYIAMDEPFWFGHVAGQMSGGRQGCQFPVPELVDRVASKIEVLRRYFPNIRIGDIEPISTSPHSTALDPHYMQDMTIFLDSLQTKTGIKLAFLHADVAWKWDWRQQLAEMAGFAHARGMRFGVICDGDIDAGNNEAWIRQALQRCLNVGADSRTAPDDLIAQSWEPLPTKMLPETDPGALTYLARQIETTFQ